MLAASLAHQDSTLKSASSVPFQGFLISSHPLAPQPSSRDLWPANAGVSATSTCVYKHRARPSLRGGHQICGIGVCVRKYLVVPGTAPTFSLPTAQIPSSGVLLTSTSVLALSSSRPPPHAGSHPASLTGSNSHFVSLPFSSAPLHFPQVSIR